MGATESNVETLVSVSTKYATIDFESGSYRIERQVLKQMKHKLVPGVRVQYGLDFSNEQFPNGIVSQVQVLGFTVQCPPLCL